MIRKLSTLSTKKNKRLLLIVEFELLALLIISLAFWRDILNNGNIEKYASTDNIPTVSAEDGHLAFDAVRVSVPDSDASYSIGYDWAKDDEDYPSVPSSVSAYYTDDEDQVTYEIFLYRDKVTPMNGEEGDVSLDSWFDEWGQQQEAGVQETYEAPRVKGYLIRHNSGSSEDEKTYCSYTYYFAIEANGNIEQYVLEVDLYDPDCIDRAEEIFKACADSITVKSTSQA